MYNEYFGFREAPFNITPDPRFMFFSEKHQEAFDHLLFGIRERKGFILLSGEVGAGKTTLCRALLEKLDSRYKTALVLNPCLTGTQLLRTILIEFGLTPKRDRVSCLEILNQFLLEQMSEGNDVILIIDEAQDLSMDLLEQVRLLSNLETNTRKLLQIILVGQPELREKLDQKNLRQLRQRITVRYHLSPLTYEETRYYINHRLEVSSRTSRLSFNRSALRNIYRYSHGIPRLINAACDKLLLYGYVNGTQSFTGSHVKRSLRELEGFTA